MTNRPTRNLTRPATVLLLVAIGVALMLAACSNDVTRRDVAASLTELVIIPQYAAAAASAEAMHERIRMLVSEPSARRLDAARESWREARSAWSRVQAYSFGPVMELRIPSLVDWWPISEEKIEQTRSRASITAEDVRESFAADQRGFSALEYLLFADDDIVLTQLGSERGATGQYLAALSEVIARAIRQAAVDWAGEYGSAFSGTGDRAIAENLAIADLVRVPVFLTETVGDMQLGVALGIIKTDADPSVIPEGAAGVGVDDLAQSVRGIQDTYLGHADGQGISDLIAQLSVESDLRMRDALSAAIDAIDSLDRTRPLVELLQTDPDAVAAARDAIKAVQIILNTEIVSLLGVTIGFSDNDGDS